MLSFVRVVLVIVPLHLNRMVAKTELVPETFGTQSFGVIYMTMLIVEEILMTLGLGPQKHINNLGGT